MIYRHLSNGIRIVMDPMQNLHSLSIGVWVLAGSVYENDGISGISHVIEHMLFKGTSSRTAKDIATQMDAIGANLNAFTSKECTCFYVKALDSDMPLCVEILSDLIQNSLLDAHEFEREKNVILEEIAMNEDSPEDLAFDRASSDFFHATPYARDILGTPETVSKMHSDDLRDYMRHRYTAENIVISAAGSLVPDLLYAELEKRFCTLRSGKAADADCLLPESGFSYRFIAKEVEQLNMTFMFPGAALNTDDSYALSVLSNILGGSMSSRLFQRVREERGLCYSIYSYPVSFKNVGSFCVYAGSTEKQAEEAAELILSEFEETVRLGVGKEEFERAKCQMQRSYLLGMESSSSHMNMNGKTALLLEKEYDMSNVLSRIESVSMEDVLNLIPRIFNSGKMAFAAVGKESALHEKLEQRIRLWYNH